MSQQDLLKRVIQSLDQCGIEYMITGSIVSSLQGEPRSTHDIDIVVALNRKAAKRLATAFPQPDFYLDEETAMNAIQHRSMFVLLDVKEGDKVDFWMLTDEEFDQSRFSRRYAEDVMGISLKVSSPEDTILSKLRWSKLCGGSEKHFQDALRVYEVQFRKLDLQYIERWTRTLTVVSLWKRLKTEAEPT